MENLKTRRICSRHFKQEDYEPNVLRMKRTTLKDTAIPSIFTFPDDEQPGPSGTKRIRLETTISSDALVSSKNEEPLLLTSTPLKIPASVQEQFSPCPSTPGGLNTTISSIEAEIENDETYQHESTFTVTSTSSSDDDEGVKDGHENKIIVNESSLMSLFKFCQTCGKPISSKTIVDVGAQRKMDWTCLGGHVGSWKSSRDVRGMPEVNLLAAAAVLFRGGTYTELSDWCKTMGVQMIGHSTFYNIQKVYLHPAIEEVYIEKRTELLARVFLEQEDGKRLHLTGDGRCDTPGFSAKYCHYTFMLDDTKEILHTELVQVTEATSSVTMEPLAFKRGMTELMDQGLDVEVMATDRSTSIQKIMREQFPNVQHQFDIWHTAKGFRKKMQNKGKKKSNEILHAWTRSVVNHMWFACATSKGDIEALKCRWKSITHHVCNEHEWTDDNKEQHRPVIVGA
ncbi:uncharacterized protein LOC127645746 [Xyrauchen texanus]|uniref:uncharacterized protein LOC127645746 n=1 Tax=Xyrauchen texanus TaxID=154827 RepID=UPI002241CFDC|nr:uncharacterized protein LOC127645746 [Xyrauchen texanus]